MGHALAIVWAWDPFIKGVLFVLVAFVLLCGSVYLVLATDLGGRLGFLVAGAGLFGWMFLMSVIWASYGIGYKGRAPSWKPKATVVGDVGRSPSIVLADFPERWHPISLTNPQVADAQAAADVVLTAGPFKKTSEYKTFTTFEKGGEKHFATLLHKPHFLLLEVQPQCTKDSKDCFYDPSAASKNQPDPTKPIVSVVLERDLGSLRQPALVIAFSTGGLFFVFCYALHLRDRALMARRAATAAPAAT